MSDHGIIFSAPMVLALLDGRKTQTRRLATSPLRRVVPGDRLWVRERMIAVPEYAANYSYNGSWLHYFADRQPVREGAAIDRASHRGRPSIHMPRWASRLTLLVTDVRVQSLNEISRTDCAAEGHPRAPKNLYPEEVHLDAARDWYMDLWNSLHTEPGMRWEDNPRVLALTFTVEQRNIDR